jgi:ring-1,2-phenylacetyl-CoA epoxidase subunit PaaD
VSEGQTQIAVARARAGTISGGPVAAAPPPPTEADVRTILAAIPDPELPVVSIVQLGMVGDVAVGAKPNDAIRIGLLPTFVGCPAQDLIAAAVTEQVGVLGRPVTIDWVTRPPWTPERISPDGRDALASAGIAVPERLDAVRCPFCGSEHVAMDSAFGPTRCRSLHYCRDCRQPFEAIKPV